MSHHHENLVGRQYGRWRVIGASQRRGNHARNELRWIVICACGTQAEVGRQSLVRGQSRSCGFCTRRNLIRTTPTSVTSTDASDNLMEFSQSVVKLV